MLRTETQVVSAPRRTGVRGRPETLARRELRAQVARLERRLGALAGELGRAGRAEALPALREPRSSGLGPHRSDAGPAALSGPHLLGLAELESARDSLVERVRAAEARLVAREREEAAAATRLEAMLADPAAHPWAVVRRADLGEPGCGAWQVRPRAGLLGMLLRWWRVKLSSGCP